MTLRLYNTLTRTVEPFVTRDPGRVAMYVCGPTVQGPPHFGHARSVLTPDVLRRYLTWRGYEVFCVRNITDVDDKIVAKAAAEGGPAAAIADRYTRVWERDIARLGVLEPDVAPRATGHLLEMIELVQRLIETDHAYPAGGDVYFRVRSHPSYGKLSGRDVDELRAAARVEPGEGKEDPLDFALWKGEGITGPTWPSPWGRGRPGWHIECSAMAGAYLGTGFDIHTGGIDLAFPHHENEIAQSEAATGEPFARWWVHNGLLTFGDEKMAKSVGNIISLAEAIDRYGADALRMFYLRTHYRSPVDFSEERLTEAAAAVDRLRAFLRSAEALSGGGWPARPSGEHSARRAPEDASGAGDAADKAIETLRGDFTAAMDDDLATPRAHAALFDAVTEGNRLLEVGDTAGAAALAGVLAELAGVLGYQLAEPVASDALVSGLVDELLAVREQARAGRDFATADRIRSSLAQLGVVVEDSAEGPRWHRTAGPV